MLKLAQKRKLMILGILVAPIILSSCATSNYSQSPKIVSPGYLYDGDYINVHSPNTAGWSLISSSTSGMAFGRIAKPTKESWTAQVTMFPLPSTQGKNELVSLIKAAIEKDTDANRFNVVTSETKYSEQRDYPCVDVTRVVEDKQAQTSSDTREKLLLQIKALYCRHPVHEKTGFAITYSYRGSAMYQNLALEAKDFIDGVQVPGKLKTAQK